MKLADFAGKLQRVAEKYPLADMAFVFADGSSVRPTSDVLAYDAGTDTILVCLVNDKSVKVAAN